MNLNLFTIKFPLTAWVSILHRISGFIVFLCIPYLLWVLQQSLASRESFQTVQTQFNHPFFVAIVWLALAGLLFHMVAGIRHLLMDNHIGESKRGGFMGAAIVIGLSIVLFILALFLSVKV